MNRDEFMAYARKEIEAIFSSQINRTMNLVERAWKEGKTHAETETMIEAMTTALVRIEMKQEQKQMKALDELWQEKSVQISEALCELTKSGRTKSGTVPDEPIKCAMCGETFTESDIREMREMGEAYHREKDGFICPDCWDRFQRVDLEDQFNMLMEGGKPDD